MIQKIKWHNISELLEITTHYWNVQNECINQKKFRQILSEILIILIFWNLSILTGNVS